MPQVGDGVTEKDDEALAGRGRLEHGVGLAIADQLAEVVGEDRDARGAVLIKAGVTGGRDAGLLRQGGKSKDYWNSTNDQATSHGGNATTG